MTVTTVRSPYIPELMCIKPSTPTGLSHTPRPTLVDRYPTYDACTADTELGDRLNNDRSASCESQIKSERALISRNVVPQYLQKIARC